MCDRLQVISENVTSNAFIPYVPIYLHLNCPPAHLRTHNTQYIISITMKFFCWISGKNSTFDTHSTVLIWWVIRWECIERSGRWKCIWKGGLSGSKVAIMFYGENWGYFWIEVSWDRVHRLHRLSRELCKNIFHMDFLLSKKVQRKQKCYRKNMWGLDGKNGWVKQRSSTCTFNDL